MITSQTPIPSDSEVRFATIADDDLVSALIGPDRDRAFEEIVRRHSGVVMGVCLRLLSSRDDAEDAFQATFLVLLRKHKAIRRAKSLASWLYGTAWRISHQLAMRRKLVLIEDGDQPPVSREPSPLELIETRYELQVLDEELNGLSSRYRDPLVASYLEAKTNEQIAQELGVSSGVVAGRLRQGKSLLRRRLLKRGMGMVGAMASLQVYQSQVQAALPATQILASTSAFSLFEMGSNITVQISQTVQTLVQQELRKMPTLISYKTAVVATALMVPLGLSILLRVGDKRVSPFEFNTVVAAEGTNVEVLTSSNIVGQRKRLTYSELSDLLSQRISFEFDEASLQNVTDFFFEKYGIPIELDEGAKSNLSVTMAGKNIQVISALSLLLRDIGLSWSIEGSVIKVTGPVDLEQSPERNTSRIESALRDNTAGEFVETPLFDAIDYLAQLHNITIMIEEQALSDEGIPVDEPISFVLSGVSLESLLHRMLNRLGLTYTIEDEVMVITTQTAADQKLETRVYDLSEFGFQTEEELKRIADTIEGLPYPADLFDDDHQIGIHPNCLVISAPYHFHKKVKILLEQLKGVPRENFEMGPYVPKPKIKGGFNG